MAAALTGAPAGTLMLGAAALHAQTGGEAGIQGTVGDGSGRTIPNASVTATNVATGVTTTRLSTGDGLFTISPVFPGVYSVTVKVAGFKEYTQQNLAVDALKLTGLNVTLAIGSDTESVTVSAAPPALETTNAVLGAVLENQTCENLPLQANRQQRDPTAFATLVPGGSQYHGILATFVRNTIFDTWGFTAPALTQKTATGATIPAVKPIEHQVEIVANGGGPIPFTRHKGFVEFTDDKYHGRAGINPNTLTIPTLLMRQGNFSELAAGAGNATTRTVNAGYIYDPTSTAACTAANANVPCRYAYQNNTIPTAQLAPYRAAADLGITNPTAENPFTSNGATT